MTARGTFANAGPASRPMLPTVAWSSWWGLFMALWLGLFLAPAITDYWAFGALVWILAGMFCLAIVTNWRGVARELWLHSIWQRHPDQLNLRLMRIGIGGGGLLIVTAGLVIAAIRVVA